MIKRDQEPQQYLKQKSNHIYSLDEKQVRGKATWRVYGEVLRKIT